MSVFIQWVTETNTQWAFIQGTSSRLESVPWIKRALNGGETEIHNAIHMHNIKFEKRQGFYQKLLLKAKILSAQVHGPFHDYIWCHAHANVKLAILLNLSIIMESKGKMIEGNITDVPGAPCKQEENEPDISILI